MTFHKNVSVSRNVSLVRFGFGLKPGLCAGFSLHFVTLWIARRDYLRNFCQFVFLIFRSYHWWRRRRHTVVKEKTSALFKNPLFLALARTSYILASLFFSSHHSLNSCRFYLTFYFFWCRVKRSRKCSTFDRPNRESDEWARQRDGEKKRKKQNFEKDVIELLQMKI